MRLTDLSYESGRLEYRSRHATEPETALPAFLKEARRILAAAKPERPRIEDPQFTPEFEALRWFPLPGEIQQELRLAAGSDPNQQKLWDDPPPV